MQYLRGFRPGALALGLLVTTFVAGCGPSYPKCDNDENCAEHEEYCVDGTCQQCREDTHCGRGQVCKGGRCEQKAECASDGDCHGNMVCRSGKCQIECTQSSDCGAGYKCQGSRCVDELACNTDADCSNGQRCQAGRCSVPVSNDRCLELPKVYFDFNESVLSAEAQNTLREVADCLKSGKTTKVTIEGHCDERGTIEYNLALGDRRGNAVRSYLERLGVPSGKLDVVSKGELEPADPGHDEAAWAKNRRAEFIH